MQEFEARALLPEFGRTVGVPELAFDANGFSMIGFGDVEVMLHLQSVAQEYLVTSPIGPLPSQPRAEFFARLLEINLARVLIRSGTLGIDRTASCIMYADRWPFAGMSLAAFERRMNDLVGSVRGWREFAAWNRSQTATPQDHAAAGSMVRI